MKWTTESPTEPGWYLISKFSMKGMVYLEQDGTISDATDGFRWLLDKELEADDIDKWAGPIEEPEDD